MNRSTLHLLTCMNGPHLIPHLILTMAPRCPDRELGTHRGAVISVSSSSYQLKEAGFEPQFIGLWNPSPLHQHNALASRDSEALGGR